MWMSKTFFSRLKEQLDEIIARFGTPFIIYDEDGIYGTCGDLRVAFSWHPNFREYFAVKATPNPVIMGIMKDMLFGFDCSSIPELILAERIGSFLPEPIMFTSNNTSREEFEWAMNLVKLGKCILNLDDITMIEKVARNFKFPELICFRYNPGSRRVGSNSIIGDPVNQKYGVPHEQIVEAYRLAREKGAKRFGLHTMICSNERNYEYVLETVRMILGVAALLKKELGIEVEFVNIGGGIGIPYKPDDQVFDLQALAAGAKEEFHRFKKEYGFFPGLYLECGRYLTGPHGVLVTRVTNKMKKYKTIVGVDACASACPRPFIYDAYHGVIVPQAVDVAGYPEEEADVVGSLCENADKFAHDRKIPVVNEGDVIFIENTGAHSWAMGFNYNGRLRVKELLLRYNDKVKLIRRAETARDYFATLRFSPIRNFFQKLF
jgi:diaminopimelate decarboxylase